MRIADFDLYRYTLPLVAPLRLGHATLRHREGLLLRLVGDDGREGWGETAPLPGFSTEGLHEAASQLRRLAGSMVNSQAVEDLVGPRGELTGELDSSRPAPSVRFGLELALWNLYAASNGTTLPALISPRARTTVPVNGLVSGPPATVLAEARRMRDAGYGAVKVKVGGRTVGEDASLVRALGEALGDAASLRLDANRAWDPEEATDFLRGTAGVRLEYVEEPLADPARLPDLVAESGVPVALDESLVGMEPEELEQHRYARAVVLKPTLLGGLTRTLGISEQALRLGMTPVVSSAYESGVGTAALVALAAGIGDRPVPAGLDTYRQFAADVLASPLGLPAPSVVVREATEASLDVDVPGLQKV